MDDARGWLRHPEAWALALLIAARVALALTLEIGRDEAAYWYWAWHGPDASYSLVTGLAVRASTALLGDSPAAVRLPTLVAGALSVLLLIAAARRLGVARRTALLGGVALAAAPAVGLAGTLVHPDAFLLLFALAFAERSAAVAAKGPGGGRLAGAAAAAALAALSKLPGALLLVPAAVLAFRHRRSRSALPATALLLAGAGTLAAGVDPGLLRGVREFGRFAPGVSAGARAVLLVAELVAWGGPALLFAGAMGVWEVRRPDARAAWPAWAAGAIVLGFFAAFAAAGQAKANWFLPGFALLVPPALRRVGAGERGRTASPGATAFRATAAFHAAAAGSLVLTLAVDGTLALPGRPALWAKITGAEWARHAAAVYGTHVGAREASVSPTRSWIRRAEEFRHRPGDDPRVAGARTVASDDYGLAFRIAHATGRRTRVLLPWDPVFARSCGGNPPPGAAVLYVSRGARPPDAWASGFREVRELLAPGAEPEAWRAWSCLGWIGTDPVATR